MNKCPTCDGWLHNKPHTPEKCIASLKAQLKAALDDCACCEDALDAALDMLAPEEEERPCIKDCRDPNCPGYVPPECPRKASREGCDCPREGNFTPKCEDGHW